MNSLNILDEDQISTKRKNVLESVKWWEKNRLKYNCILIGLELIIMIYYINTSCIFSRYRSPHFT